MRSNYIFITLPLIGFSYLIIFSNTSTILSLNTMSEGSSFNNVYYSLYNPMYIPSATLPIRPMRYYYDEYDIGICNNILYPRFKGNNCGNILIPVSIHTYNYYNVAPTSNLVVDNMIFTYDIL